MLRESLLYYNILNDFKSPWLRVDGARGEAEYLLNLNYIFFLQSIPIVVEFGRITLTKQLTHIHKQV